MATLIFYGVLIAALAGGALAIRSHFEETFGKKALAPWSALIGKCQDSKREAPACAKEWTDAVAANLTLQADVAKLDQERQECSNGVKRQGELQVKTEQAKTQALAAVAAAAQSLRADSATHRAKAQEPTKPGATCEQTLSSVDSTLRGLAARRLRDHPPNADRGAGESNAAGHDPDSGSLRIAP